jgi:hypothetical protein
MEPAQQLIEPCSRGGRRNLPQPPEVVNGHNIRMTELR